MTTPSRTRPLRSAGAGLLVLLGAASAAGAATRVRNGGVEAPIQPFTSAASVITFYAYGNPDASSANTGLETFDTSLLFLYQESGGPLSLVAIHDRPQSSHPPRDTT